MNKFYAGIGSRETPQDVCLIMTNLAKELESLGYILRSGGANGADKAFQNGVQSKQAKQIFIPWRGFNAVDTTFDSPSEKAMEIAENFHPAWKSVGDGGKKLHARNSHIILGPKCDEPVEFVICWTKSGKIEGGTGQGMRIAAHYKIPIYNLNIEKDVMALHGTINNIKNQK